MRWLATVALAVVFVLAFVTYFIGAALVSHITDADAVVASARDGDMHGLFVDVVEASLAEELASSPEPEFRRLVGPALRPLIVQVMSEKWFYETFAIAYGGFAELLSGRDRDAVVDLSARIEELRERLYGLGARALASCRGLAGASHCRTELGAERVHRDYRASVDNVLRAIPGKTSLSLVIDELGGRFLPPALAKSRAVRDGARTLRLMRYGLAALLLILATLIALINRPGPRILAVLGAVFVLASIASIWAGKAVPLFADEQVHAEFARRLSGPEGEDAVVRLAVQGTERVVRAEIGAALGDQNALVVVWIVGGALCLGLGLALGRRRR